MRNFAQTEQNWHPFCNEYQPEIPGEHMVMVRRESRNNAYYALCYKGFELSPTVHQLKESRSWELRVAIAKHRNDGGKASARKFSIISSFQSMEDAAEGAILFVQQIIDGEAKKSN